MPTGTMEQKQRQFGTTTAVRAPLQESIWKKLWLFCQRDQVLGYMLIAPAFILLGYFRTIPQEIEECAMVDGCTRVQALIRIVSPVAIPGIVCAILFAFTISWNEFIYALTFISSTAQKTTTVGVTAQLIRGDIFYWGSLMAGAVLGSIPIVLVYVTFMDYYVSGLTQGAIK
jgi:multiple sugar transport system permease protein